MNYQQTIDYLYLHLPMFSRIGTDAYKKDLHNTIALCNALNNPQTKFKSIHIAGTNGKGSTSHMLAAILQKAGYKTGLYTSPHLKDFRERIKVNGTMINKGFVTQFVKRTKSLSQSLKPSFFELTVALAFDYFAHKKVDIAIIETGLGGRLDSTNIITPILSIITNIGYDHINILGNTLQKIATEKAGIIKPNTPIIIGEYLPPTKKIFVAKAISSKAPIYFAQNEYQAFNITYTPTQLHCTVKNIMQNSLQYFALDLNGLYQTKNLCTVLCAQNILQQQGFSIKNNAQKWALAHTKRLTGLQGRWDVIAQMPTIILDVAHNEDGIKQVIEQLQTTAPKSNYHFIMGMVKDKEINKVLSLLPTNAQYYFTHAHIPRALTAIDLQAKAAHFNLQGQIYDDVNIAIATAKQNALSTDVIIVVGSVFLVGEVDSDLAVAGR